MMSRRVSRKREKDVESNATKRLRALARFGFFVALRSVVRRRCTTALTNAAHPRTNHVRTQESLLLPIDQQIRRLPARGRPVFKQRTSSIVPEIRASRSLSRRTILPCDTSAPALLWYQDFLAVAPIETARIRMAEQHVDPRTPVADRGNCV